MADQSNDIVMIVDDEEMVLTSLNSFFTLETDYEIVTFTDPHEALNHVQSNDVDLVMSDYLMPDMDGMTFLAGVRDLKPEIPRIILTGYADKENAIKGINEIGLFHYIQKPWDNDDLSIIVRNGLEKQKLLKRLQEKVEQIDKAYSDLQGIQQEILKAFT